VALIVSLGLGVLLAGLWYIQIVSVGRYRASLQNQTFRTVRIPATRGKLLDRNGLVLAENRPSYNLNLYLDELRPEFQSAFTGARAGRRLTRSDRERLSAAIRWQVASNTIEQISAFLGDTNTVTERAFRRHHNQWPYRPLTVRENLNSTQIARFLESTPSLAGLDLEVQPLRHYPRGPVVAHLLGYLTRDDLARDDEEGGFSYSLPSYAGAVGLEYLFDEQLRGQPGTKSVVVNSLCYREGEMVWLTASPGQNAVLALDLPLQQAAFEALRAVGSETRGAAVVLDASNGDVLALVSHPAYDPNEFVSPLPAERWAALNDPTLRPMFNRATQGAYNPGSIFKIITALAALESGLNPEEILKVEPDLNRPGKGAIYVRRRKVDDTAPPGDYNFKRAFKYSSNSYFIQVGLRAGRERLLAMGRRFHLGERFGLGTRQEVAGVFPTADDVLGVWNEGNIANVCIGQEITVTPLQMATVTAAVANGGRLFYPRLVHRLEPAEPGLGDHGTRQFPPRLRGELGVSPQSLATVRDAMLADTEETGGTGFAAFQFENRVTGEVTPRLPGFRVGGKTGTAQVKKGSVVIDHITWFVAFGPYESPRYVVVVMVESGGSGGGTCAPVARQIFQAVKQRLEPAGTATSRLVSRD
jgi:penicillin-binding protein 2